MMTISGRTTSICDFLADYAAYLLGCGATCIRIENNVRRISRLYGVETELTIMPTQVQVSAIDDHTRQSYNVTRRIRKGGINYNINTQLSRLSWCIADGKINLEQARSEMQHIIKTKSLNKWKVLVGVSLANLSFCRLFGGDFISMLLVFAATFVGFKIKQDLLERKVNVWIVTICSAFVSAVIASAACVFELGNTPDVAVGTSVLYLVPGIPYINSVSDMLNKHYICAFCRFVDALILTVCLSLGLYGGYVTMGLQMF